MSLKAKKIVFSSMLIALAFALSAVKIIRMPMGGAVTLFSMFVISMPGYFFGIKYGFSSAIIFSLLNLFLGGVIYSPVQAFLDYILAYGVFGITGFFSNNNNKSTFILAYTLAVFCRFVCTSISGYIFFADYAPESWNPILYTVLYNGGYIFTEAIITIIIFLNPYISMLFYKLKGKFV